MKYKYPILVFLSCCLTILTQIIYHYIPLSDSIRFLHLARQYHEFIFFDPLTNCYGHQFYSLFLAIIGGLFSYHHFVVGFIQTLIFCLSSISLIRELEVYSKKKLFGLIIFLFLIPEIHFYNGSLLTESLSFSLIILIFALALRIYNRCATIWNMLLLSLLVGINLINRTECGVIIFPVVYLLFPKIKDKLLINFLMLMIFPVFILLLKGEINYKTYHVFNFSSFNGGEVIYGGNNMNLDGSHHVFQAYKEQFIPKNKIDDLNKIQMLPPVKLFPVRDSFYLSLAIDAWRNDPLQQLGVIPEKFAKNWLLPGNFDIYTSDTTKTRGLQLSTILSKTRFHNPLAPYKHLFYMVIHWILLAIIIAGLVRIKRQNRFQISVLILLLFFILFTIPFCGLPRWHVPIFPILIIAFTPYSIISRISKW